MRRSPYFQWQGGPCPLDMGEPMIYAHGRARDRRFPHLLEQIQSLSSGSIAVGDAPGRENPRGLKLAARYDMSGIALDVRSWK